VLLALAGLLAYSQLHKSCYGVGDVWKNARMLEGKRICITGKASTYVSQTLLLCDPPSCNCNQSSAGLTLVSEDKVIYNDRVNIVDEVVISQLVCSGNECTMTCVPFNPFAAERFQFTGQLSITYLSDGRMAQLKLTDLDLPVSRQLVNGNWQPIPTGSFTH